MRKKLLITFGIILVASAVFGASAFLQSVFDQVAAELKTFTEIHNLLGILAFAGLSALSVLLGPFTSIALVPWAAVIWGPAKTTLLLFGGWLVGNTLAYLIGRFLGYPLIAKILGQKKLDLWIGNLSDKLNFGHYLLFRLGTPSETGYVFGLLKYNFKKYMLITVISEGPFAVLAVFAGDAFAKSGWGLFSGLVALWFLLIGLAWAGFNKRV